jgi:hypothetical protein
VERGRKRKKKAEGGGTLPHKEEQKRVFPADSSASAFSLSVFLLSCFSVSSRSVLLLFIFIFGEFKGKDDERCSIVMIPRVFG